MRWAGVTPHKPQAFGYQKHPIGIHAGRSSARSVRQRAGAALHAFILTCALRTRLGNAALIPELRWPWQLSPLSGEGRALFQDADRAGCDGASRAAAKPP